MRRDRSLFVVASVVFGATAACAPQPQTIPFRSLESTGTGAFVCLAIRDGDRNYSGDRFIEDCPDTNPVDGEYRQTFALVTQPNRGEVAVIAVNVVDTPSGKAVSGGVIDQEPAVPGFNFLPIGARPVDIVASPGSAASFVATGEVGKEGIYALPSSCVLRRDPDAKLADGAATPQPVRDISLWPACHLPATPGKMTMLIDRTRTADGVFRKSCDGAAQAGPDAGIDAGGATEPGPDFEPLDVASEAMQAQSSCPARVYNEEGPEGRRKLLVSLPDLGQVVLIDAQSLLDRPQGSFENCDIERTYSLKRAITPIQPIVRKLPPDLGVPYPNGFIYPPPPEEGYEARPTGFARLDDSNEHKLFIADSVAPMIHRLDTTDPCNVTELPPLLPLAPYGSGPRTVTTTSVAVMDHLTSDGKRFLYAIDQAGGGQVMIFDVSPDSALRTPIIRERSPFMPFEEPDRLAFSAPAVDVAFVTQNSASVVEPATGVALRQECDPTPLTLPHSPGTAFQPTLPDYSSGARPSQLRGTFGLVALSSGHLAVVDVEDLDKPCRRPSVKNSEAGENFRGCAPDDVSYPAFTKDGQPGAVPTVTDEVTCQVVERHRSRSSNLVLTNSTFGPRAPSIRVLPRLIDKDGRSLLIDATDAGRKHPKMLGVNFKGFDATRPENRAQVFVGTDFFATPVNEADNTARLQIDPAKADKNSVVLSLAEPRAYGGAVVDLTATYEGKLLTQPAGVVAKTTRTENGIATDVWILRDTTVNFCFAGVESSALFSRAEANGDVDYSKKLGVTDPATFQKEYADHLVITAKLLSETDAYWKRGDGAEPSQGATCNGADPEQPGAGFIQCRVLFGTPESPNDARKFRITDASRDTLTIEPKEDIGGATAVEARLQALACCFPDPVSYTIRATKQWFVSGAGASHPIIAGASPGFECRVDPNPLYSMYQNRVYEVACNDENSPACLQTVDDENKPIEPRAIIGPQAYDDSTTEEPDRNLLPARACIINDPRTDMQTIGRAAYPGCMFVTNQSNFVIYRGTEPSQPDMQFQWSIVGGFTPQVINMSLANDANTSPQSILRSPFNGTVMVADGGSKGLVVVDLTSFGSYPIN